MIVAFLSVKESPRYAQAMIWAVRRHMPDAPIFQLADEDTPLVDGARAIRMPNDFDHLTLFRMHHLSLLEGDVLCLDTDVIVQADLRPIFSFDFDVALTKRDHKVVDQEGRDLSKIMPYNTGVTFQRSGRVWGECLAAVKDCGFGWYSDQLAAAQLDKFYRVLKLNCDNFNHKPASADEDIAARYAVHYKGKARKFLDERIDRGDFA